MRTDAEARAFEREAGDAVAAKMAGSKRCRGYPLDHYCMVLLPSMGLKYLCHGCEETLAREHRELREIATVGEILETMPAFEPVDVCPCGGDRDGFRHEESLLHLGWKNGGLQIPAGQAQ